VQFDAVGTLTRSVADSAHALQAIAGYDPKDPYCADAAVADYVGALSRDLRGLRIGVPTNAFYQDSAFVVLAAYQTGLAALRDLGLITREFDLPRVEETPEYSQLTLQVDGATYYERYREREDKFNANFRAFVLPGREHLAMAYAKARQAITAIRAEWLSLFEHFDLIATPSCPTVTSPHGTVEVDINRTMRPFRMVVTRFTRAFTLVGFPTLTMPSGLAPDGLPTSIQLAAPPFAEARLLAVAHQLEEALGVRPRLGIEVKEADR
jgi:aspartyl-tRNA(Asn)/glutamyl-tRNA(Gln) amidotransferase subunit A